MYLYILLIYSVTMSYRFISDEYKLIENGKKERILKEIENKEVSYLEFVFKLYKKLESKKESLQEKQKDLIKKICNEEIGILKEYRLKTEKATMNNYDNYIDEDLKKRVDKLNGCIKSNHLEFTFLYNNFDQSINKLENEYQNYEDICLKYVRNINERLIQDCILYRRKEYKMSYLNIYDESMSYFNDLEKKYENYI